MDVLEFLRECKSVIATVKQGSNERPRKTRQSVFLEQYPETELYTDGVLGLCPKRISVSYRNDDSRCITITCSKCRREFWMQGVE